MQRKRGGLILLIVASIAILTVSLAWNGLKFPPRVPPANNSTISSPVTSQSRLYIIRLIKLDYTPDNYVELTEEELLRFPELKLAFQALNASGETEIYYAATEQGAMAPHIYLFRVKYCGDEPCKYEPFIKYQETFYIFSVGGP